MQNVGNGSITKTILEFLKADGEATLYTTEVDAKYVRELAYKNNIPLTSLRNKHFKSVTVDFPLVAWRYN